MLCTDFVVGIEEGCDVGAAEVECTASFGDVSMGMGGSNGDSGKGGQ